MINLDNLVSLHDNKKTVRRHRRILEELFYLCINESFLTTIQGARETLRIMTTEVYVEFPCSTEDATRLRNAIYGNDYRTVLSDISNRHHYFHPSFIRDYLQVASDSDKRNMFNVLENIIFFNNPIPDDNPFDHFNSRSGYVEIANDEVGGPYIRMHFDLGTTRKEIMDIIDKDFPETSEMQASEFNIPNKQFRADSSLRKKQVIHTETKLNRNLSQISVTLDNDGSFGSDNIAEQVRSQNTRTQEEVSKYNAYD